MARGVVGLGVVLWATLAISACCGRSPDILNIWAMPEGSWTDPESRACDDWDAPVWNGTTELAAGSSLIVVYQDDDDGMMKPEALQLFDSAGAEVALPMEFSSDHNCHHGCPSPRRLYRLDVPPGTYTLVHLKRHGTNKPVHTPGAVGDEPWSAFEGEAALVTTLIVTAPAAT